VVRQKEDKKGVIKYGLSFCPCTKTSALPLASTDAMILIPKRINIKSQVVQLIPSNSSINPGKPDPFTCSSSPISQGVEVGVWQKVHEKLSTAGLNSVLTHIKLEMAPENGFAAMPSYEE